MKTQVELILINRLLCTVWKINKFTPMTGLYYEALEAITAIIIQLNSIIYFNVLTQQLQEPITGSSREIK
jgi:hypothetical protein